MFVLYLTDNKKNVNKFQFWSKAWNTYIHCLQVTYVPVNTYIFSVDDGNTLEVFRESLSKFTRFTSLRSLATLSYASDLYNSSSIVSSIEFDRDADYFAIAGVTKKIKVWKPMKHPKYCLLILKKKDESHIAL